MTIAVTLSIILIILSFVFANLEAPFKNYTTYFRIGAALVLSIGILMSSFVQVDSGNVGVKSLFGKVQNDPLESGLHLINPFMDVEKFDIRTQNYTMSAINSEGQLMGDDAIRVLTSDGLEVSIDLTVLFRVLPSEAPNVFRKLGTDYAAKIVRPVSRTRIRDFAVDFEAISMYSNKRELFQTRIFDGIERDFKKRGLVLEQVLIRNIDLPKSVKQTIESKINAEQEARKMQYVLDKERQEAERKRVEAQGIADYQRIISTGLTDKQLQYEQIKAMKELSQSNNSKVIVMGGKNAPQILIGDK